MSKSLRHWNVWLIVALRRIRKNDFIQSAISPLPWRLFREVRQTLTRPFPCQYRLSNSFTRERFIWITLIVVLLLSAIALAFSNFRRIPKEAQIIRFLISPADQTAFSGAVISPDGRRLAISIRDSSGKYPPLDSVIGRTERATLVGNGLRLGSFLVSRWSLDRVFLG